MTLSLLYLVEGNGFYFWGLSTQVFEFIKTMLYGVCLELQWLSDTVVYSMWVEIFPIEIMGSKSCTFVNSVKYMYFLLLGQEKRGVDKLFINCLLDQVMVAK